MASSSKSSLSEKLKALGLKIGTVGLVTPKGNSQYKVDLVVPGEYIPTPVGEVFVSRQVYPADYQHGKVPLGIPAERGVLTAWLGDSRLIDLSPESFTFLDIETSGLAGGTGTYAFLIGLGRFKEGDFHLDLFFMRDPAEELALLHVLEGYFASTQALVTFNGRSFDAPILATRFRMHDIPVPFVDYPHLDLLPLARRLWKDRLPSRALKYLEESILGVGRTDADVPGYEIPYLYFDYLRTGDARPLSGVFYHNAMDVVAMAALLNHMGHMLAEPMHTSIEHGLDRVALARLYEKLGKWEESARLYERCLQDDLLEVDFWQVIKQLSSLHRRRGDLESAVILWEKAASNGHVFACVELAKHNEHRLKNYKEALRWTMHAKELLDETDPSDLSDRHRVEELEHRRARLEKRAKNRSD